MAAGGGNAYKQFAQDDSEGMAQQAKYSRVVLGSDGGTVFVKHAVFERGGYPVHVDSCMVEISPEVDERGARTGRFIYTVTCFRSTREPRRRGRVTSLVHIPAAEFGSCDERLWVRKYRLPEELAQLLGELCRDVVRRYPPAAALERLLGEAGGVSLYG